MDPAEQKIADLLEQSIGLTVNSIGSSTFRRALNSRKKSLGIAEDRAYLEKVKASYMEMRRLIEEVVVPETWFFRDQEPFTYLTEYVYRSGKDPAVDIFRLLSLPCSTGEEAYSIAMTMLQAGLKPTSFYVDAVDVSSKSLTAARMGMYKQNSFRSKDLEFRDRFFFKVDEGYALNAMVREKVRFIQGNILQPGFLDSLGRYDVVFCRNLLIYFNKKSQEQAIKGLYNLLLPGGLLFTGHSEASLFMGNMFRPVPHSRAFAFVRQEPVEESLAPPEKNIMELSHRKVADPPALSTRKSARTAPKKHVAVQERRPEAKDEYADVRRLADAGNLEAAAASCEKYLMQSNPQAKWYYLLGIIRDSMGRAEEAKKCFRKAVYLDPGHAESLIQLALLAEREGDAETAENYKRRAKRVQGEG